MPGVFIMGTLTERFVEKTDENGEVIDRIRLHAVSSDRILSNRFNYNFSMPFDGIERAQELNTLRRTLWRIGADETDYKFLEDTRSVSILFAHQADAYIYSLANLAGQDVSGNFSLSPDVSFRVKDDFSRKAKPLRRIRKRFDIARHAAQISLDDHLTLVNEDDRLIEAYATSADHQIEVWRRLDRKTKNRLEVVL